MRLIHRVSLYLIFATCGWASAQQAETKVTLKLSGATLEEFAGHIEAQTDYRFFFNTPALDTVSISVEARNNPLIPLLDSLFNGSPIFYAIDGSKNIFLSTARIAPIPGSRQPSDLGTPEDLSLGDEGILALRDRRVYEIGKMRPTATGGLATVSGYVRTNAGDPVADVAVSVKGTSTGTATGRDGYFVLKLRPGAHVLVLSSVGFKTANRQLRVFGDGTLDVTMLVEVTSLEEVVVTSNRTSNTTAIQMGTNELTMQTIRTVPTTFGESDVLKAILTLPGVKTIGEASAGFNVRGGATDQNLILLNGSTIYNPFHFFGFFSSFNSDAIDNVELFKGSVPAAFGGRLASVLKVSRRVGDKQKMKGSAGIGLLTGRVNVEGPILKDKASFLVGARKTYSNWIFGLVPESSGYRNAKASFSDVNIALDFDVDDRNSLKVTGYMSRDESNLNTDTIYSYANRNFAVEWNRAISAKTHSTASVAFDHFSYGNASDVDPLLAYKLSFSVDQVNARLDFTREINNKHTVKYGMSSLFYRIHPGSYMPAGNQSSVMPVRNESEQALESAVYVEDNFEVSNRITLSAGLRYSFFNYLGARTVNLYADGVPKTSESVRGTTSFGNGEIIESYHGAEPRVSLRYMITDKASVKTAYTAMRQYVHLLSNSVAISPTDVWKLSDPNIRPQAGQQLSVGFYKTLGDNIEASVEGYTKRIRNYLDYKSGAVLVMNPAIEQETLTTRGNAYGLEVLLRRPSGNFNGWLGYTYSRVLLIADDPNSGEIVNRGKYYPASYDKPHDLSFTGNQKISKRFNVSLSTTYSTGRPVTIPIGVFYYGGQPKTLFSQRNSYRIDDYFRMDISFNVEGNHRLAQALHNSWTFGVYNLTGRRNPYSVYFTNEGGVIKGYKMSIFGAAIPFINYNIRFR